MDRPSSISELIGASSTRSLVDETAKTDRRSVHFAPCLRMIHHIHVDDYSDREFERSFYSKKDYKRIRDACRKNIQLFNEAAASEEGTTHDESLLCFRGLEKTGLQLKLTQLRRKLAREMVFKAQQAQWRKGEVDEASVAKQYREISHICHFEARVQGLKDEEMVQGEQISDAYDEIRCTRLSTVTRRRDGRFDCPSTPGPSSIEPPKRMPPDNLAVPYLANPIVN
jgi:hypothetical protein